MQVKKKRKTTQLEKNGEICFYITDRNGTRRPQGGILYSITAILS